MRCPRCNIRFVDEAGVCSNRACSTDHELGVSYKVAELDQPGKPVGSKPAIVPEETSPDQRE